MWIQLDNKDQTLIDLTEFYQISLESNKQLRLRCKNRTDALHYEFDSKEIRDREFKRMVDLLTSIVYSTNEVPK